MVVDRVGGSGAGGAGISGNQMEQMLAGYATQEWTASNYVSIEFFSSMFKAYAGTIEVAPNGGDTTTIDNIEARFGFWTEQYISALGQGSGGGGGGQGDVTWALLADNSDNRQIASSHITDLLGGTFIGKNYAVQRDDNGKLYVNVPWTDTTYSFSNADATLAWSTRTKIATVGGTDIYVTMPANPNTDHYDWDDITNKPATAIRWPAFSEVTGSASASQLPNIENLTNFSSRVYDATVNRTANTVLAGPASGNAAAATFRALVAADIPSLAISKITGLQTALDSKLDIAFFSSMFKAYAGTTEVAPNGGDTTTIDNIKAMFGFWTKQYLSALGQGSGGGGGGQGDVTWALLADNSDNRQIASSHITDLLGGTFSGKNYAVQRDANGKLYVSVPWLNTTYGADNGVGLSGTTFYNSGVRAASINGNYLRVNTNGTNADLTIPYATNAGTALVGNKLNVMATIIGQDTANYPWRLLAQSAEITTNYQDTEAIIVLRQYSLGGRTGILKIAFRTNEIATTASGASAVWLDRFGFSVDDVRIAVYWVANKSYADVFVKATAWNRMEMHVIGNRDWTFYSSSEGLGGSSPTNAYASIEAAATALHGRAYTNIVSAQDGGTVNYANSAGAATNDSDGNAINSTYLKKSGGTMTGTLKLTEGVGIESNSGAGLLVFKPANWTGISNTQWGVGAIDNQGVIRSNNSDLIHYRGGTNYNILDSSNSSVSKSGETLTVKINGTSQSLTNTWRPVVDNLTSTDTDKSLSANQGKALKGYIDTLNSRFDNSGNAYTALALTTVNKTLFGNTYWTSEGVPASIGTSSSPAALSYVTNIDSLLYFDRTNNRIGIGTNSPSYKLHVTGAGYFTGNLTLANNKGIYIKDSDGVENDVLSLDSNNKLIIGNDTANENYDTYLRGGAVYLQYGGSNTGLIINSSGNVGIGTTSPSYKLHVSGDIYATGGVTSLSDIRKKNVTSMVLPLSLVEIANAPAIKFTWKDEHNTDVHVGTIAQYWASVLPEVVKHRDGVMSMQYDVTALACAIIDAREIAALKREVNELKKELMKLKIA